MKQPVPLTLEWAGKTPLSIVCTSIADTCIASRSKPSGAILAHIVKRLIAAETKPGGPYRNEEGVVDLPTNLAIGYLFHFLESPLPRVTDYIETHRHKQHSREVGELFKKYDNAALRQDPPAPLVALHQHIFRETAKDISQFDESLQPLALQFLKRIQKADKSQEIALMPQFFHGSLSKAVAPPPLEILSMANIYCWIAYMIYDHLIDGQSTPEYLPVANVAMRASLRYYQNLFPPNHSFQKELQKTFNNMDAANAWELAHCRLQRSDDDSIAFSALPTYGQFGLLARRSFGHALGPLAIAHFSLQPISSIVSIRKGFHHYLIARQLCDDIHDWQEDIREGSCSAVVAHILRSARVKPGIHTLGNLVPRMQHNFWRQSMETTNVIIARHIQLSRHYFIKSGCLFTESPLFSLLIRLELTVQQSSEEHARYKDFAATYRQS